jgi:16S rRNA (guanine966-N2)-methyltransferase
VRIIAGSAKGLRLQVAKSAELRPTGDRQRETLFNVIRDRVEGATVLDLFAGTGALGVEALSRGADTCVFVEHDRGTAQVLRSNLEHCRLQPKGRVITADWHAGIRRLSGESMSFDLLLADPPWASDAVHEWLTELEAVAAPGALLCLERERGPAPAATDGWTLRRTLQVGDTAFHLFDRKA